MIQVKIFQTLALTTAATLALGVPASVALAAPKDKVKICHATGSETNPYVLIEVDEDGANGNGKNDHTSHEDDLIPAPEWGCPEPEVEDPDEPEHPDDEVPEVIYTETPDPNPPAPAPTVNPGGPLFPSKPDPVASDTPKPVVVETPSPTVTTPAPVTSVTPTPEASASTTATPTSTPKPAPKDCKDFATQADAKEFINKNSGVDLTNLDGDNDGTPCEHLPTGVTATPVPTATPIVTAVPTATPTVTPTSGISTPIATQVPEPTPTSNPDENEECPAYGTNCPEPPVLGPVVPPTDGTDEDFCLYDCVDVDIDNEVIVQYAESDGKTVDVVKSDEALPHTGANDTGIALALGMILLGLGAGMVSVPHLLTSRV